MKRSLILGVAVACAVLAGSSEVRAAGDANGMGQKGQLIVSADRLFSLLNFTHYSVDVNNNTTVSTSSSSMALLWGSEPVVNSGGVSLVDPHTVPRVAVDFTVIDRLTLGGSIALAFGLGGSSETKTGNNTASQDSPTTTVFGFAPRVGYIIPVGDILALWPRGGFSFYSVSEHRKENGQGNATVTVTDSASQFSLDLDPVLAIVPIPHLFFTVGPIINIPLTGKLSETREAGGTSNETSNDLSIFHFGIAAGLGGWFQL